MNKGSIFECSLLEEASWLCFSEEFAFFERLAFFAEIAFLLCVEEVKFAGCSSHFAAD